MMAISAWRLDGSTQTIARPVKWVSFTAIFPINILPTPISRSGKGAEIDCGGVHHLSDLGPDANVAPWIIS